MKYFRKNNIFNIGFHLIFVTKRRIPILHKFEKKIKKAFRYSAIKNNFLIHNLEIMPDHIHLFIKCKTCTVNLPKIVQSLKGYSSYCIRKSYINRKKILHLWSPSYFTESIGNMSEKVICNYIKNQKINVKSNYKYRSIIKNSISYINDLNDYTSNNGQKKEKNKTLYKKQHSSNKTKRRNISCSF